MPLRNKQELKRLKKLMNISCGLFALKKNVNTLVRVLSGKMWLSLRVKIFSSSLHDISVVENKERPFQFCFSDSVSKMFIAKLSCVLVV